MSHPQLDDLARQLDEATARARHLSAGTAAAAFSIRPSPNAWSAAECLAHLNTTTAAYLPLLDAALASAPAARASASEPRYKTGFIGGLLAWTLEPPYRMKTKTAARFVPGPAHNPATVLDEFIAGQQALKQRLAACEGRDLNRIRLRSPFNDKISYNVYAALKTLCAHERRHLWQGEQALRSRLGAGG